MAVNSFGILQSSNGDEATYEVSGPDLRGDFAGRLTVSATGEGQWDFHGEPSARRYARGIASKALRQFTADGSWPGHVSYIA
ncbi:hypothetical protein [Cellulomonas sp. NPDC089187]|uniref:hypothetical protein n=1 Tax=Cellulomonas sp. NPDC089187 TaxID=3154970 RepID=UPI0034402FB6